MERSTATSRVVTQTETKIIQNRQSFFPPSSVACPETIGVVPPSRDDKDVASFANSGLGSGEWCKVQQHVFDDANDATFSLLCVWVLCLASGE